ncbi:hypothetical protein BAE44_0023269 [Dichanthelium oligosanthes]|uniref:Transcription factor TFIIIB component B'' Myb domain-containing protein n=1 Tax=Dichanthelium oligosanthes TaxID=888268 RepID=A0A1E5US61_9POAL|nr:hypothetical protein BAE44_0023269 [Dichanthelium oligosanthes]
MAHVAYSSAHGLPEAKGSVPFIRWVYVKYVQYQAEDSSFLDIDDLENTMKLQSRKKSQKVGTTKHIAVDYFDDDCVEPSLAEEDNDSGDYYTAGAENKARKKSRDGVEEPRQQKAKEILSGPSSNKSFQLEDMDDFDYIDEETRNFDNDRTENHVQNVTKLNYHSHMNKQTRAKWSKSDTDLFYKGLRQFGSDFAVIEQLIPGKTHHQIICVSKR